MLFRCLFGCPYPIPTTRYLQFNRKGLNMSVLKTLNFVAAPKRTNDPIVVRRNKLITQLQQQRALAEDPSHIVITQRWRKGEDGSKRLVERQKRVKRWWSEDAAHNVVLLIKYGSRIVECEKGRAAIAVGEPAKLVPVIDAVIGAVAAGELDAQLDAVQKLAKKTKQRLI